MSNSFPSVPTDFALSDIVYSWSFYPSGDTNSVFSVTGCNADIITLPGLSAAMSGSVPFQFTTPGEFGTFDQTTIEAAITAQITAECQLMSDASGDSLATVQASVGSVQRTWGFTDGSGWTASYSDTMTYPPA